MVEHGPVSSLLVTLARLAKSRSHNLVVEQLQCHTLQGLWALRGAHILIQ